MKRTQDVMIGSGTVVRHNDGGWALPGVTVTYCRAEAERVARELAALIDAQPEKALAAGIKQTFKPVTTVRLVSGLDAERHTVSA